MRYLPFMLPLVFCSIASISCSRNQETTTRFHEDGRAKPVLAIASMIDTTSFDASWSLSEEFTTQLVNQVGQKGNIFVVSKEDEAFTENPFGQDLNWVKKEFPDQEFVVFLELVEHETSPASKNKTNLPPQEVSMNLNMAVRLRVIDLRGTSPKIVLQEMIRDSYFIPKTLLPTDYSVAVWGTDEFRKSPMGIAHAHLIQEIADRVSDYVLLAKSR